MNNDQNGSSAPQAGNLTDVIGSWVAEARYGQFGAGSAIVGTVHAEPMRVEQVSFLQLLHALHAGEVLKCDRHVKNELLKRIPDIDPQNEWALSSYEKADEAGSYYVAVDGPCNPIKERLAQCVAPSLEEFKKLTEQQFEVLPKMFKEDVVC